MSAWIKIIWVIAIIVNAVAVVWFLLGSTANFQRSLDLVGVLTLIFFWTPSLVLVLLSTTLLIKKWVPLGSTSIVLLCIVIFLLLSFSLPLFEGVKTRGWLYDYIQSDPIKISSDGKYEYRIELINSNQKNRHERLYVRNVSTREEMYISVDINTDELKGLSGGGKNWAWALMSPTDVLDHYELTTTENLRMPMKKFLIDVGTGVSRRLK